MSKIFYRTTLKVLFVSGFAGMAMAAGLPLTIEPVDTSALPDVGEEWLIENPYRDAGDEVWMTAIEIGASGYNQNCARCHGLGAISGGLAPDVRMVEAEEYGDEWYVERFRLGATQNGVTKMPAFGELLGQKAAWAIRTYIETRPDEYQIGDHTDALLVMRDDLTLWAGGEGTADPDGMKQQLSDIAAQIETLSGAPIADSVAFRAARQIDGTPASYALAAETLTVGLSVAQ